MLVKAKVFWLNATESRKKVSFDIGLAVRRWFHKFTKFVFHIVVCVLVKDLTDGRSRRH